MSNEFPSYLMIRDTGLHDDSGGLGQRIFTTAGAGYEKCKYIRVDIADADIARFTAALNRLFDEWYENEIQSGRHQHIGHAYVDSLRSKWIRERLQTVTRP